ncbi:hypothetical protein [Myxococcus landrumensis]|uniref:hypothetical protein n=1 Tax=Myxococcus landrumensis TaxID=2813577 RepID=UPI001F506318|nr:hypothetical protein [Myxococcus landrumus]
MTTKSTTGLALVMAVVVGVTGCATPNAAGGGDVSASNGSSDGSGDSSKGSGDSSKGSGESSNASEGTGNSSGEGGSSESRSSGEEGSSKSKSSGEEGTDSRSESSNSEKNDGRVLSATTVVATVIGLGVVIWRVAVSAERRRQRREANPEEVGRAAQVYLRSRTHQLREDLALGAGPTVEDLAAAANIRRENLGTFGRLLRANRGELLAMADTRTLTPERALAWLERVGELARTDPKLDEDRLAFLAAQGEEVTAEVAR